MNDGNLFAALGCALLVVACSADDAGNRAGTGSGSGGTSGGGTETGRLQGMLAAHNAVRAGVNASPALPALEWSDELAAVAQAHAEELAPTCELVHSKGPYGENLAMLGGQTGTPEKIVDMWAGEGECWTFGRFMESDQCSNDCGACGHYTQLVWRDTQRVGCGVATCAGGGDREVWVCNYDPPGNFIGQEPY